MSREGMKKILPLQIEQWAEREARGESISRAEIERELSNHKWFIASQPWYQTGQIHDVSRAITDESLKLRDEQRKKNFEAKLRAETPARLRSMRDPLLAQAVPESVLAALGLVLLVFTMALILAFVSMG